MAFRGKSFASVLEMELVRTSAGARLIAEERQPGHTNYITGRDPAQALRDVPHFGKVRVAGVYRGVDLAYYGRRGRLEYDFIIAPGADPRQIRMRFRGHERMEIAPDGDLVFHWGARELRHERPALYQLPGREKIEGRFLLAADGTVGFDVPEWDRRKVLVIDPVLSFGTYLGGTGNDLAQAIAVDSAGNAYIGGITTSTNFPTQGPYQDANAGGSSDAFVTKINATGTAILYSTYIGGSGQDQGLAIAVDAAGSAYLAGYTASADFPVVSGISSSCSTGDAFLAKLAPAGNALTYALCLGGSGGDVAFGVGVDDSSNAFVTGWTDGGLPVVNAAQPGLIGGTADAFVGKLDSSGTAWVYLTYLGGSALDIAYAIGVNGSGAACVTGQTQGVAGQFPVVNALQPQSSASFTAFVARYTPAGTVVFATLLGGSSHEEGTGAAVDAAGNCYVTGLTTSTNFPTANAAQSTNNGREDAFVAAYNPTGSAYLYSTYAGGTETDYGLAIDVTPAGTAHVAGASLSSDFPLQSPLQAELKDPSAVYSSTNAASSFSLASAFSSVNVNSLAVDPTNAQILYAGTSLGVYKTVNGGTDWTRIDNLAAGFSNVLAVVIDPNAPCTLFAGVSTIISNSTNTNGVLAKSVDCGVTWGYLSAGPTGRSARSLAISATNPAIPYIAILSNTASFPFIFYKISRLTASGHQDQSPSFQLLADYTVATDPANGCTAYAGDSGGMIFKSTSCETFSWAQVGSALSGGVRSIAAHPTNQATLLAGTSSGNLYRKVDGASPWTVVATFDGAVNSIAYDPANALIAYAATGGGVVYKTVDGGASWTRAFAIGPQISSLVATNAPAVHAAALRNPDAFYLELTAAGAIAHSTLIGGHGFDVARGVAVAGDGTAVIAGTTTAIDFPVTAGVADATAPTGGDSFVIEISRPPAITVHPASQVIPTGPATMTVMASGSAPLSYQWYAGTSGTTTSPIAGATSSSYTTPASASTASYWVRVSNAFGTASSNTATIKRYAPFTDHPLIAGITKIRAVHVTQLRMRIDALRVFYGLGVYSYADPTLTAGSTRVRTSHITDLRTALAACYAAAALPAPAYTNPVLTAGTPIRAAHIAELRTAVGTIE